MCISCLKSRVDITEDISKQIAIQHCRSCERYLNPPTQWLVCQPESKELLSLCLKRLKIGSGSALNSVRLVDAGFLWTEPHSRRLKLKITVQKEIFTSTILQQTFPVEVVISNQQCINCAKVMAKNTWNTNVQVRQKVSHQRTFLHLEQLILKHKAHADCVNIKKVLHGLDFFFSCRTHAIKFIDFLESVVPVKTKSSEQLLSKDIHSGHSAYKFTFSVELLPICKGDLICLPSAMARQAGISSTPLVLITKVGKLSISMIDPATLRATDLPASEFWHHSKRIQSLFSYSDLKQFVVLDVTPLYHLMPPQQDPLSFLLADVEIGKESDGFSTTSLIRTHLGKILHPGDHVLGYDLNTSNPNNDDLSSIEDSLPQMIYLVKKFNPRAASRRKSRSWKLKHLKSELGDENHDETESVTSMSIISSGAKRQKKTSSKQQQQQRMEQEEEDLEIFLQEIEDDIELRSQFNLYKAKKSRYEPLEEETDVELQNDVEIDIADLLDDLSLASDEEEGEVY